MRRASWVSLLCVAALSACGHTVLDQRVDRQGDGWTLAVRKVIDGPNRVDKGDVVIKPDKGDRFIWVVVTLRNDQGVPRKFSWDRCDLDAGGNVVVPGMISHDFAVGYFTELGREPELASGESIDRKLVFVYPEDRSPTRLKCAPMVVPLPQF
jgi:hypothetical protein